MSLKSERLGFASRFGGFCLGLLGGNGQRVENCRHYRDPVSVGQKVDAEEAVEVAADIEVLTEMLLAELDQICVF